MGVNLRGPGGQWTANLGKSEPTKIVSLFLNNRAAIGSKPSNFHWFSSSPKTGAVFPTAPVFLGEMAMKPGDVLFSGDRDRDEEIRDRNHEAAGMQQEKRASPRLNHLNDKRIIERHSICGGDGVISGGPVAGLKGGLDEGMDLGADGLMTKIVGMEGEAQEAHLGREATKETGIPDLGKNTPPAGPSTPAEGLGGYRLGGILQGLKVPEAIGVVKAHGLQKVRQIRSHEPGGGNEA